MKFSTYIVEGVKENIITILNTMTDDEIQEFGEWLYDDFLGYADEESEEEIELEESEDRITKEEIIELLGEFSMDELQFILDMLGDVEEEEDSEDYHDHNNPNIEEGVSRRMAAKDRNLRRRKKFQNSKADMRRTKVARKKAARMEKASRKKYYRANKVKKKAYNKSYRAAVASGKHKKKIRIPS